MGGNSSPPNWADPSNSMINQMRQIASHASVQPAKDNTTACNVTQIVRYARTIFITDCTVITITTLLNIPAKPVILLTCREWWKLGRDFSLSPLEIARAFNAPLLQDSESNATWGHFTDQLSTWRAKHGYMDDEKRGNDRGQSEMTDIREFRKWQETNLKR